MANQKLSELAAAVTPLDYTEAMELLQSGGNVKVAISELFADLNAVQFNTAPTPGAHSPGLLYWDSDAGTLAIMTDVTDVVLQVGQEQYVKVRNNTGVQIDNGEAVYITGAIGNRPTVALAQADAIATLGVLGLATEDIANNADGYVTTFGLVRDLDTHLWAEGDNLFLSESTPGAYTNAVPATGYSIQVAKVLYSHNTDGIVLCQPSVRGIIGDVSNGNYLEVKSNGFVLFHGTATAWDDLRVPLQSTKLGGSKDPDFSPFKNDGGTSQGVFVYYFSPSTEEELYFAVQLPHGWVAGSNLHAHLHWVPAANGAAGQVVNWGLEYTWSNLGAVFGNTTIIFANDTEQGDASLVQNKHYLTELGEIDGTGKTLSSMLICRVFRDAAGALATDDFPADAGLLEVDFHYEIESLGSDTEYA